jgi:hypothetical protein
MPTIWSRRQSRNPEVRRPEPGRPIFATCVHGNKPRPNKFCQRDYNSHTVAVPEFVYWYHVNSRRSLGAPRDATCASPRRASFVVLCRAESHCASRGCVASSCGASRVTPCTVTQVKPRRSSHAVPCELCRASRVALGRAVSHASCVASCESRHVAPGRVGQALSRCATPGWVVLCAVAQVVLRRAVRVRACARHKQAPQQMARWVLRKGPAWHKFASWLSYASL